MRAALYAKYGLDQPIYIQFFRYVGNMLRGDFGVSYNISKNTPISQLIQSRLPISIQIGGMAVMLGAVVGLVLGIIAALKRDTVFDTIATIISVIGVSVPSYVFALALSYTFGFKLRWFPMLFSRRTSSGPAYCPACRCPCSPWRPSPLHPQRDDRSPRLRLYAVGREQGHLRPGADLPPRPAQRPHAPSSRCWHR